LLQVTNGLFSAYNLQTAVAAQSIGPWTGGGFNATGLATDQGKITLFPSGDITFAASGGVAANVPEPTTFALFGLGILGFIVSVLRTRYHPNYPAAPPATSHNLPSKACGVPVASLSVQ
jgi:hypothetical protein